MPTWMIVGVSVLILKIYFFRNINGVIFVEGASDQVWFQDS